jgi:hypothetical protein
MSTNQDLIDAIEQCLGQVVSPGISTSTAAYDLFEVFIFGLVVEAAKSAGAQVSYQNIDLPTFNGQFTFRTSPGNIYSRKHPYTYAQIEFANQPALEAHIGIYATGVSSVRHECDIAVLSYVEAENCRRQDIHPRSSELLLTAECKFYVSLLSIGLGRSFLGLVKDIHSHNRFFVTNSASPSLEKLLAHHKIRWQRKVIPSNSSIVGRLTSLFEEVFQNFVAVH